MSARTTAAAMLLALLLAAPAALGQSGIGIKFGSDFNYFHAADKQPTVEGWYSNWVVGVFYKHYLRRGCIETGLNVRSKNLNDKFNLPGVSADFNDKNNTAFDALEATFLVGPRILKWIIPKVGMRGGVMFSNHGFIDSAGVANGLKTNNWYLNLPVGIGADLPAGFGTVGVSLYYEFGLTNVINGLSWDDGGKRRTIYVEIHANLAFDRNWRDKLGYRKKGK